MSHQSNANCSHLAPANQCQLLLPGRTLTSVRRLVRRQRSRAHKRGLPATLTVAQWYKRMAETGCTCFYCGGPYESLEHVIPLNANEAGTTYENCVTACFWCNERRNIVGRAIPYLNDPIVADLLAYDGALK